VKYRDEFSLELNKNVIFERVPDSWSEKLEATRITCSSETRFSKKDQSIDRSVAPRVTGAVMLGLWRCNASLPYCSSLGKIAVGFKYCSTTGLWVMQV